MRGCFIDYSLSLSLLLLSIIFLGGYIITLKNGYIDNNEWNIAFAYILNKIFLLSCFTFVINYLLHRGSRIHIEYHQKNQEKLERIMEYLEIEDNK